MLTQVKWLFFFLLVVNKVFASPIENDGDAGGIIRRASLSNTDQVNQRLVAVVKDGEPVAAVGNGGMVAAVAAAKNKHTNNDKSVDSKEDATAGASISKSLSDDSLPDSKSDDTSEENEDSGSKSNPATEEEGDSSSESNTTEENDGKSDSDEEPESEEGLKFSSESESDTTEEDTDESADTSESSRGDSNDTDEKAKNKLLVILLNGVRPEFITRDEKKLPTFGMIADQGVHARYVKPVFPSTSLPNAYSIATGKFPSKHGIINDYMYDKTTRRVFMGRSDKKEADWWNKAEPIWTTARKQNKGVHVSWWMGCEIQSSKSKRPSVCEPFKDLSAVDKGNDVFGDRLVKVVDHFEKDDFELALVYYNVVGAIGRKNGPNSRKTIKALREVDEVLARLMSEIHTKSLEQKVNVVILSDHGMTQSSKTINLERYVDFNDIEKVIGDGAFVMISPEKRKTDHVYDQLLQASVRGLNVYKREKLPSKYHLKENDLVLPIVLTADEGYVINTPGIKNKVFPEASSNLAQGHFGYDPDHVEEMNAIFYAFGPDFRQGYASDSIRQVDFYNLFCHLVGIKPKNNDGHWGAVQRLLRSEESAQSESDESEDNGTTLNVLSTLLVLLVTLRLTILNSRRL